MIRMKRQMPLRGERNLVTETEMMSPKRKKIRSAFKTKLQLEALAEVNKLSLASGGVEAYGHVSSVAKKYFDLGLKEYVDARNLYYRLGKQKKMKNVTPSTSPASAVSEGPDSPCDDLMRRVVDNVLETPLRSDRMEETREVIEDTTEKIVRKTSGRPKGTSKEQKRLKVLTLKKCMTEAAYAYQEEQNRCDDENIRVPDHTLSKIARKIEFDNDLHAGSINTKTIRSRIASNNLEGTKHQCTSPIDELEPEIASWCCELAKMGSPVFKSQVISLANELVSGTEFQVKMNKFKKERKLKNCQELGSSWYNGFMQRYSHVIRRGKCRYKDNKRSSWCTLRNFENMYNSVYDSMVEAGVAVKLDEEVMLDVTGKKVLDVKDMYGRKTKYLLTKPENCLFVDETGCNTNQKDDGHVGGRLFVLPADDSEKGILGCTTDIHFTVMCFTNGNGEPVMCAIIIKSKKDIEKIPIRWRAGIDITKNVIDGTTEYEVVQRNCGEGQAMSGGPTCFYKGKYIPCFVGSSPMASISSVLLRDMLRAIDSHDVFERSNGSQPFLLLDGHFSRLQLPFLEYITDPAKEGHQWKVCIGVPYGTHLWQVHDASSMNGAFKILLTKSKSDYLKYRNGEFRFVTTDIVPLVKMCWEGSFGRVENAKSAIASRGWGPLNFILLDHPKLVDADSKRKEKKKRNKTNENATNDSENKIIISNCNRNGPLFAAYVDKAVKQRLRNKALREKHESEQIIIANNNKVVKHVNTLTNFTSGGLSSLGKYVLDESVYEVAKIRSDTAKAKEDKAKTRKIHSIKKKSNGFVEAFNKYKSKETIVKSDYIALIKHTHNVDDDSPIKSLIKDIKLQFERRKHRLFDDNDETTTIDQSNAKNENDNEQLGHYRINNTGMSTSGTLYTDVVVTGTSSNTFYDAHQHEVADVALAMCELSDTFPAETISV